MFGPGVNVVPAVAGAQLGHYFVGNIGDVDATGWSAAFRTTLVSRVQGSVDYSMTTRAVDRDRTTRPTCWSWRPRL